MKQDSDDRKKVEQNKDSEIERLKKALGLSELQVAHLEQQIRSKYKIVFANVLREKKLFMKLEEKHRLTILEVLDLTPGESILQSCANAKHAAKSYFRRSLEDIFSDIIGWPSRIRKRIKGLNSENREDQ